MSTVGVHEAKTNLSKLLRRVMAGEEVVITRNGEPLAKLVPAERRGRRVLGIDDGRFEVPADFDTPLPDDMLDSFEA